MSDGCISCISKTNGFFCGLQPELLTEIDAHKVIRIYKKGEHLVREKSPAKGIFCIKSGLIKIMKTGNQGKETITSIAKTGDLIGHNKLFEQTQYTSTAIALETSYVCYLDRNFILKKLVEHPDLSMKMLMKMSQEMNRFKMRLTSLLQKNVKERLAEFILKAAQFHGTKEDERIRIDLRLSREEMASILGTVNETVIRFMTEFKRQGLIEEENKFIYITDLEELIKIAQLKEYDFMP